MRLPLPIRDVRHTEDGKIMVLCGPDALPQVHAFTLEEYLEAVKETFELVDPS